MQFVAPLGIKKYSSGNLSTSVNLVYGLVQYSNKFIHWQFKMGTSTTLGALGDFTVTSILVCCHTQHKYKFFRPLISYLNSVRTLNYLRLPLE